MNHIESLKYNHAMKADELKVLQEIYADEAYLKYMKDRWGIDFKSGTFAQKANDACLDGDHFFSSEIEGQDSYD